MYHVPWGKMINKNFVDLHNLQFEEVSYSNDIMFSNLCGYYAKNIYADQNITYCITDREESLTKQMRKEPLRCRTSVVVRRNKFLYDKKIPVHCVFSKAFINSI